MYPASEPPADQLKRLIREAEAGGLVTADGQRIMLHRADLRSLIVKLDFERDYLVIRPT
jgi:hypothetical protein